jgi:hypothetical protein
MTDEEYTGKLEELDHLLNDPEAPLQPARIWSLLAEISERDLGMPPRQAIGRQSALSG